MYNNREYVYSYLVNGATPAVTVFSGRGTLHSLVVGSSPTLTSIVLSDGATPFMTLTNPLVGDIQFDVVIANSLKVLCADTSPKILITYTKG
jgi:hypothetical protein